MRTYPSRLAFFSANLLAFTLFFHSVFSQTTSNSSANWKIREITTNDGLSNRFVNDIQKDSRGFVWIATNFGLNRYDGNRFDIFTRENNHLHANSIYGLNIDPNQKLWILYKNVIFTPVSGIDVMDPVSFQVIPLEEYLADSLPFKIGDIREIRSDDSSNIYILTTHNDVYQYTKDGLSIAVNPDDPHIAKEFEVNDKYIIMEFDSNAFVYLYDHHGNLLRKEPFPEFPKADQKYLRNWHFSGELADGSLTFMDRDTFYLSSYYANLTNAGFSEAHLFNTKKIHSLNKGFNPEDHKFYVYGVKNLFSIDPVTGKIEMVAEQIPYGAHLFQFFGDGLMWLSTDDGVKVFSKRQQYFESYLVEDFPTYSCR